MQTHFIESMHIAEQANNKGLAQEMLKGLTVSLKQLWSLNVNVTLFPVTRKKDINLPPQLTLFPFFIIKNVQLYTEDLKIFFYKFL